MKRRLSSAVAVRRHFVAGRELFVLSGRDDVGTALVGAREWALLSAADGTRDIEGVVRLAARKGVRVSEAEVAAWFEELAAQGVLVDAADSEQGSALADASALPERAEPRELSSMPGFRMRCDGRGTCCRMYPTTVFDAAEMARACGLVPEVFDGGEDVGRAFTPVSGADGLSGDAAGRSWAGGAVGMRDGQCGYLDERGCRIHAAAGALAKPAGCRLYPAAFCDDGERVRVAPRPECACVFRSARRGESGEGELLVAARTTAELEPAAFVQPLPEVVAIASELRVPRERYLAWHRGASALLTMPSAADAARRLVSFADELAGTVARANLVEELAPELAELRERVRRRAVLHSEWRAPTDLARLVPLWIRDAIELVERSGEGEPMASDEAFYLATLAYGHLWFDEAAPLAPSLRQRAVRVLVARWIPTVLARGPYADDPALEHPLALVEAFSRLL